MSKLGLDKALAKFETIKTRLPRIIANDSVRFFLQGFDKGGFTDATFKAWAPRKGKQYGRNATRKILVDTGALRRSVSNSVKRAAWDGIRFEVELSYASYVNAGTEKMPKRKFIGESKKLTKQNKDKIIEVINDIWQE